MIRLIPSLLLISIFYNACQQPTKTTTEDKPATGEQPKTETPFKYDLTKPVIFKMPEKLEEISGIAFNKGRPDTMYAEQDEEGKLFYFSPASLDVKHQKFGKRGDYEDIAVCNGTVIMLRSDGVLFSFPLNINEQEEITNVQETADILPRGEYESMHADEAGNQLYVLC